MQHRSLKHLLVVALLAGGLAVLSPAQVHAAPLDAPQGLWKWLARVWGEGATVLWEHPRAGRTEGRTEKAAVCTDPSGCTSSLTLTPSPTCRAWNEAGACIDPNG